MLAVKFCFVAILLIIFSANLTTVFASDSLLTNADFESWDGEVPSDWTKNVGTLATSASDDAQSGANSALLQSSSTSTKYLCQVIPATPNTSYHFSGWTKVLSGSPNAYFRAVERTDSKCTATAGTIKNNDSSHVLSPSWKQISLDFITSDQTKFLETRINLDPPADGSTTSLLWDDLSLTVNTGQSPSPDPSPSPDQNSEEVSSKPTIDFSPPSNLPVATTLSIPIQASHLPDAPYYVKIRLGPDPSHLTRGQTYQNGWLDDNDAWQKFPQVTVVDGSWQGSLNARLQSGEKEGSYKIKVRFKKVDSDTFYESDVKEVSFKPEEVAVLSSDPEPTSNSLSSLSPKSNPPVADNSSSNNTEATDFDLNSILGLSTQSASSPSAAVDHQNERPTLNLQLTKKIPGVGPETLLLFLGFLLIVVSGAIVIKKTLQNG
ncbi:MAG: hypothetical protein UY21_C0001G0124 [Microgenomates group bacterium GW2011_GWA1_48_10]|nr:MAG: hypothetical protein UY21_C0001G0124 [Microgenomates group bacterium GW2011_GWA1_48_10]